MEKINKIKIIFGLGNPGDKYFNTPHNFGRDLLFNLIQKNLIFCNNNYNLAFYKNIYLAISNRFMNESGIVLKEIIKKINIKNTEEILVIHDEADLPFLYLKITFNKSSSMHKGIESIYKYCGKNIWRLRIGIQDNLRKKAEELILKKLKGKKLKLWQEAKKKNNKLIDLFLAKPIYKISIDKTFLLK
ncbi:MAG: hypothetical protein KatS3mg094_386 [Candidatus Parcubacteria bacterium]|nr:MAG: hypothetical protein KatS3mg094_386 [Candidatus Parcubacteria bacterium]